MCINVVNQQTLIAVNHSCRIIKMCYGPLIATARKFYTLVLHKNLSSEAYRAVYKALNGVFTGLSRASQA